MLRRRICTHEDAWYPRAGYPALVHPDAPRSVEGVVLTLDPSHVGQALDLLDAIEGTDMGLYRRIRVQTASGNTCWTYDYLHPSGHMLDLDGRWA